jgi:ABC-2 type transport system permease protein
MMRFLAVLKKEYIHIIRDRRSLGLFIMIPFMLMVISSYAFTFDIKNVAVDLVDMDKGKWSRKLVDSFTSSGYFYISKNLELRDEAIDDLLRGNAKLVIEIGPDFSRLMEDGALAPVQLIVDGSDPNAANIFLGNATAILSDFNLKIFTSKVEMGNSMVELTPIDPSFVVFYNPALKSRNFMIPGMAAVIMLLPVLMTALSIVREKERGNYEQLIATPIRPISIVLGKLLPYASIAIIDVLIVWFIGVYWFKVPFEGSLLTLFLLSFDFFFAAMGVGLLISTVVRTQQEAMILSMVIFQLPSFLLSGLIFPIISMPVPAQFITYLVPVRYFIKITRGIFLKGTGLAELWEPALSLFLFGCVVVSIAALRFKKRLA